MTRGIKTENFEKVEINESRELRDWLEQNHTQEDSVWVVTYKKAVPEKYVSTENILDELLCFGWIDGVRRKLDETRTMQLISKRQTQYWSRSYKTRAARLIKEGLMEAPGLASIEAGKQSGLWNFLDDVEALVIPEDLKTSLESKPPAYENFVNFSPSSQRNMLRRIKLTKTQNTRAKYIEQTASLAAQNKKVPQT